MFSDLAKWSAWWAGDPDELSRVYGGGGNPAESSFSERGGLVGAIQRFFWGQQPAPGEQRTKLHVPLASEIAEMSADLLFGKPPTISVDKKFTDESTQERIDYLFGERTGSQLHEAAETCAALGHVYLRVGWDLDVDPTGPLLSVVDADAALPRFAFGRLQEVTFVREWNDAGTVLRHFEFHEPGMVWHAAYLGDVRSVGRQVPLGAYPETSSLVVDGMVADDSRDGSGIPTKIDRLDVVAVKNARSRTWRHIPEARDLGRADISGVEQDLDALDDVWSSWMRDIRHGRSRITVPSYMLETQGPGKPATVNLDRELYDGLRATPEDGLGLTATQFKIRFEEHRETARSLTESIVNGAGYSLQTFGLDPSTNAQTATDSWARQMRTQHTRNGKLRHWKPALRDLTWVLLAVDREHFNGQGDPELPVVVNAADTVSESAIVRAQTAQALRAAEAASTETLVAMVHDDWDAEQIAEEVARIEGSLEREQLAVQAQQTPMDNPDEPVEDMQEDPPRQA